MKKQPTKQEEENFKFMSSIDEMTVAVRALKNNKALRMIMITGEMLKSAGNIAHELLHKIVKII